LEAFLRACALQIRWRKLPERVGVFPERSLIGECAQEGLQRAQEVADSVGKSDGHALKCLFEIREESSNLIEFHPNLAPPKPAKDDLYVVDHSFRELFD
jgi:hypothetical protein